MNDECDICCETIRTPHCPCSLYTKEEKNEQNNKYDLKMTKTEFILKNL
jgi:hypothetical protein